MMGLGLALRLLSLALRISGEEVLKEDVVNQKRLKEQLL